ncbi:MAG: methyltransferase domain-containing protein [Acidithiobacillales bacterium]
MSFWIPERVPSEEILDGDVSPLEAEASLSDIEWVHRRLGGRVLLRRHLLPLLERIAGGPGTRLSMLDLGCGSGHVGRDLVQAFARRGGPLDVLGLDLKISHARLAERGLSVTGDALRLPFADGSADVVFSTLFLHHFSPDDLRRLLLDSRRVARKAVIAFDLSRHRIAAAAISIIGPLAFRTRISTHDGRASVLAAYTPTEIAALASGVLPGATVNPAGPFVWQLVWARP